MIHKPPVIKSKKIRESAKGESCTFRLPGCKGSEGVVLCHIGSRWKGMGNKSPDIFAAYGCWHCHGLHESGKVSAQDELRAMQETQMRFYQKGLITIP